MKRVGLSHGWIKGLVLLGKQHMVPLLLLVILLQCTVIHSDDQTAKLFSDQILWTTLSKDVADFQVCNVITGTYGVVRI